MTNTQLSELSVTGGKIGQTEPLQEDTVTVKVPAKWDICSGQWWVAVHQFVRQVMNYILCIVKSNILAGKCVGMVLYTA